MKLKNPYSLLMLAGIGCVSHLSNGWQSQKEKSRGGGVFNYIQPSSRSKVCLAGSNQNSQADMANESHCIVVHCMKLQPVTRLV